MSVIALKDVSSERLVQTPAESSSETRAGTFVEVLLGRLEALGVRSAFGLVGGAIAPLAHALALSRLEAFHFRHEGGAGFAAVEASLASGRPTVLFTTTGPGLLNALTPVAAGRWEGAKLLMLSGSTSSAQRGRWACQETSSHTLPQSGLFTSGPLFHYATTVEHPAELDSVCARLASGFARPGGFIAHVSLPLSVQTAQVPAASSSPLIRPVAPACSSEDLAELARMLAERETVLWVGFGARHAAAEVRALAERLGAPVMSSPRGKGIFPERHPLYLGSTGLGGHATVDRYFIARRPEHVLVLGSRLSEPTSFWNPLFIPTQGFIHVDVDPEVPGSAYPTARVLPVQAEVKGFLQRLLELLPAPRRAPRVVEGLAAESALAPRQEGPVRPRVLMERVQSLIIDRSDAVVMTESGNAFAWGNQHLRFEEPGRYRVSTGFGSMGHMASGVVGLALARGGKAVAIVGDGSMLMNNELSTAAQYSAPAVWIIMNDAQYGMVEQGMRALGFQPLETAIPRADFVSIARACGADGVRVEHEQELDSALEAALAARGPFVVDVAIDPHETAPWMRRIQNLIVQGAESQKGGER
ncbi:thiamine pyrophosphate-dependent enzyme [Archangium violaceum]|uniref:thiamine pyrophosphate-dependent enzyme n=1 Tax=Archangium violaceum TaxID=83451 RepID=UPI0037BE58B8